MIYTAEKISLKEVRQNIVGIIKTHVGNLLDILSQEIGECFQQVIVNYKKYYNKIINLNTTYRNN